ncbi:MAG: hypothetical protein P8Y95_07660 [Gammaproteobacteria bacterium]
MLFCSLQYLDLLPKGRQDDRQYGDGFRRIALDQQVRTTGGKGRSQGISANVVDSIAAVAAARLGPPPQRTLSHE